MFEYKLIQKQDNNYYKPKELTYKQSFFILCAVIILYILFSLIMNYFSIYLIVQKFINYFYIRYKRKFKAKLGLSCQGVYLDIKVIAFSYNILRGLFILYSPQNGLYKMNKPVTQNE